MTEQPSPDALPAINDRPWTAHDVAEACGRSVDWAWKALARWTASGQVTVIGADAVTNARLYASTRVWAAWEAERDHPTGR